MKAQDFISSPDGLFTHFQGMQTEGLLIINWILSSQKNKPDQLVLTAI
jgi:hypothetical protein